MKQVKPMFFRFAYGLSKLIFHSSFHSFPFFGISDSVDNRNALKSPKTLVNLPFKRSQNRIGLLNEASPPKNSNKFLPYFPDIFFCILYGLCSKLLNCRSSE